MKTIYEHIKENTLLSSAWYAACYSRKMPRASVRTFDVKKALHSISELQELNLNFISRFILGLVRLYWLKYKLVYEDFSHVLSERKVRTRKKLFKALPLRPITVEVDGTKNAETVEATEQQKPVDIGEDAGDDVMEPSIHSTDNFEVGYSAIEDLRESTGQNATATQIDIRPEKRRKSVLDKKIEYDTDFFDKKVRNIREILRKENEKKPGLVSLLGIQPEIIQAFQEQKAQMQENSIELARGHSMTDVSYDPGHPDTYTTTRLSDSVDSVFSMYNLPDEFVFQTVVESFGRKEQAISFMSLLTFLNNGQFRAQQEDPYGPISCVAV